MGDHLFYAGISLPLQQLKADLCAGINEEYYKAVIY